MYQYPLEPHPEPTGVRFSCPDIPEVNVVGDTLGEAFAEALNGLESALSLYVEQRRKIPAASVPTDPTLVLHLPAVTVAKIMLWNAMLDEGISRTELARRMGCTRQVVGRLVDFIHASKIDQVERALGLLGRRLSIALEFTPLCDTWRKDGHLSKASIMTDLEEKARRLADWYDLLSNTVNVSSLDAWHRELRREVGQLKAQGLIDAGEAYELSKLADAAYGD